MPKYHNTSLALEAKIKLQTASDKWKAVVNRVDHKTTIFLVSVTLRNDGRFGMAPWTCPRLFPYNLWNSYNGKI